MSSRLIVNSIRHTGASGDAVSLANDGTCTANITNNLSNKNLVINGDMRIFQRSTSVNKTGANSTYTSADRYRIQIQSGTITESQQDLSSSDTPYSLGFRKFLRVLNQSGIGAGASQYCQIDQLIEAQDIAQSGWNYTSTSSFITLSFWVRASVTQAYYGWIRTEDGTQRHYPYKICDSGGTTLTADTWTKITVTVPGNSGLTINNDNGAGLFLTFVPYYGTNYTSGSASLDAWNTTGSGTDYFPDNTTTWATTTNATFDITGIQLEVSDHATDFEHRSFGDELAKCQRYFFAEDAGVSGTIGGVVSPANVNSSSWAFQTAQDTISFPVQMRIEPTCTFTSSSHSPSESFISRSSVTFTGRYLSSGQYAYITRIEAAAEL